MAHWAENKYIGVWRTTMDSGVAPIEIPLGSSFRLPTEEELERVRREWTAPGSRYLVRGKPVFWNWFTSYVDRMRDPGARISIRDDTRAWLGGSRDMLFRLLRALGYRGASVFRTRTRLISAPKAEVLYDMMVRENREQTEEEQVAAGIKMGAFAATKQIERGIAENTAVIQAELELIRDSMRVLKGREAEWIRREKVLKDTQAQYEDALRACRVGSEQYKAELEDWRMRVLDADQRPPPPPPPVPSAEFAVDDDELPPMPPPDVLIDEGVVAPVNRIEERADIQGQKAAAEGRAGERVMLGALQDAIRAGTVLKTQPKSAKVEGAVQTETLGGLSAALEEQIRRRRMAMRPPEEEEEEEQEQEEEDDDWYGRRAAASCRWCGGGVWIQCECEQAFYCGGVCMAKDAPSHLASCRIVAPGVRVPPSVPIGVIVSPKSANQYSGRYADQGSPSAYRVIIPGVRFGEELILEPGAEYTFVAYGEGVADHPLYIADAPRGGTGQLGGQVVPGVLRRQWSAFVVNTADLPQDAESHVVCDHHPYMGFALRVAPERF